jgi:predicted AlkP superfamily pyrophosphatase or phosphodiesterase
MGSRIVPAGRRSGRFFGSVEIGRRGDGLRTTILMGCAFALGLVACAAPTLEDDRDLTDHEFRRDAMREAGPPTRIFLITVSGLDSSNYLDPWGHSVAEGGEVVMPNLAKLAREGAMGIYAIPPSPGSTRSSHATLVTGLLPPRHGVIGDGTLNADGGRVMPFLDSRLLRGTALWDAAIGRGVLSMGWPTTGGARIELLIPEVAGGGSSSWLERIKSASSPMLVRELESIAFADVEASPERDDGSKRELTTWPTAAEKDAAFVETVCRIVASDRDPGLWLLQLNQAGDAQRLAGYGSVEVANSLSRVDDGLGRLRACLEAQDQLADTAIFVVGDVAYKPVHSSVAPNVALVNSGLIGRDPRSSTGVRSWLALVRSHGRSAYLYARDAGSALEAREVLEVESELTGAFEVVSAKDMTKYDVDPQAWFGLVAAPGFTIGNELTGDNVRPAEVRSAAGSFTASDSTGAAVGFVAWGRGIRQQIRLPILELVDVAPTIAALLGVRLGEDVQGAELMGILRASMDPPPMGPKRLGAEGGMDVDEMLEDIRGGRRVGQPEDESE